MWEQGCFFGPCFCSFLPLVHNKYRERLEHYEIFCHDFPDACDHDFLRRLYALAQLNSFEELAHSHVHGMHIDDDEDHFF